MPLPGAPPRRQDRVTHLARLDGLPRQEPLPGPGQPAVTGHLRPQTCSARHACPQSATAAITGPSGILAGPGALAGRAGTAGAGGAAGDAYRRGAVLAGRGRVAAGGAPSSSSRARARRSAAWRSSAAKSFIVSPVPHPQPPGQRSGPAACNGHRQPQPDARHCERHDHGDGDGQAGGVRSCGSPG